MSSTSEPLVSVFMATYNTEYSQLREAVESVINQTYTNWELILIDDCSTEYNDFSFLDEYHDSRIKLYHNEHNMGCTCCYNKGIDLCTGEYLARLDADDISFPDRLAKQVKYMQEHPDVMVLSTRFKFFGAKDDAGLFMPNNPEYVKASLLLGNGFCHSTIMYRRTLFTEGGIRYDESFRYAQDYDLIERIHEQGFKVMHLPECLVYYRVHLKQISSNNTASGSEQQRNAELISDRQIARIGGPKDNDKFRDALMHASLSSEVTIRGINEWTLSILNANKESRYFDQHFLRLVFAERYVSFMNTTGDYSAFGFVVRTMGLELIQSYISVIRRRAIVKNYRRKYGSTGKKS